LGRRLTDYTGGFNMYALALLKSIDLDALNSVGYGFVIDLKYQALVKARRVVEIPIVFQDRQYGRSKMPTSTVLVNFFLVLKIKLQSRA
jgi:dolichol-phosphate mannosyltransferase